MIDKNGVSQLNKLPGQSWTSQFEIKQSETVPKTCFGSLSLPGTSWYTVVVFCCSSWCCCCSVTLEKMWTNWMTTNRQWLDELVYGLSVGFDKMYERLDVDLRASVTGWFNDSSNTWVREFILPNQCVCVCCKTRSSDESESRLSRLLTRAAGAPQIPTNQHMLT